MNSPKALLVVFLFSILISGQTAWALSADRMSEFDILLKGHGLSLDKPSQRPLLQLLLDAKLFIGRKTYIIGMRYITDSQSNPGASVLETAFPPFVGPPGTYLMIFKPNTKKKSRMFYDCAVHVDGVYMMETSWFLDDVREKLRTGIYQDPMVLYAVPFKEMKYAIPIVSEVECLQ